MAIEDPLPRSTDLPISAADGATITVPTTASSEECAAVAAAIGAHIADRRRAEADDEPPAVDPWKLAGRLGVRDPDRLPQRVPRGGEWKAAARTWQ